MTQREELIKKAYDYHSRWSDDDSDTRVLAEIMVDFCMEQSREALISFIDWCERKGKFPIYDTQETIDEFLNYH